MSGKNLSPSIAGSGVNQRIASRVNLCHERRRVERDDGVQIAGFDGSIARPCTKVEASVEQLSTDIATIGAGEQTMIGPRVHSIWIRWVANNRDNRFKSDIRLVQLIPPFVVLTKYPL